MGMKKIDPNDELTIVKLLRKWPQSKRLTWNALRSAIIEHTQGDTDATWSRQSLSANESIRTAFGVAKGRAASPEVTLTQSNSNSQSTDINEVKSELAELRKRYDNLLLRHNQLVHNVSLLEGGTHLLDDPLPDNTRSQGG
jgi:hypothetical protein